MSNNPTTQSPVSDAYIPSDTHNPFNLPFDIRGDLIEIFCTAFYHHKEGYLEHKQDLKDHLAKANRNEDHDKTLISLCDFSEGHMLKVAKTYRSLMGSDCWLNAFNEIVQENTIVAINNLDTDKE